MAFFSGICGSFAEFCVCFCPKFPAFWSVFCLRISTLRHWNWHPNKSVYQNCGETSGSKFQCFLFLGGDTWRQEWFNYPQRTAEPPKNHTGPWQTTARQGRKDAQAQQCQHPEMKWMTDCFHGQDFLVCFAFQTFTPITNMCLWSNEVPGQYLDSTWTVPCGFSVEDSHMTSSWVIAGLRLHPKHDPTFDSAHQAPDTKRKWKKPNIDPLDSTIACELWTSEVSGPVNRFSQALARKTAMPGQCFRHVEDPWRTKNASTHKNVLSKHARKNFLLKWPSRSKRPSLCHRSCYCKKMIHKRKSQNRLEGTCN